MSAVNDPYEGSGKIGACSWSLQLTSPSLLVEAIEITPIRALQVALVPMIEEPRVWTDVFQSFRDSGIEVLSGMFATPGEDYTSLESIRRTGGVRPDQTWPVALEQAIRVADLAAEAGLRLVTFHAGFIPHDVDDPVRAIVLERIRMIGEVFAKRGVSVGLETGQETAETLLSILKELDCPSVGVNFDPANMILYGMGDPVEALTMLSPYVVQVHIKDAIPAPQPGIWGTETRVGDGAVDWSAFLSVVETLPKKVDLVIERESGSQRVSDIIFAYEFLQSRIGDGQSEEGAVN